VEKSSGIGATAAKAAFLRLPQNIMKNQAGIILESSVA
jgi:hypothetical protein